MGGETFDNTNFLTLDEYTELLELLKTNISVNYLLPFRLKNKDNYSDVDFIVFEEDELINQIKNVVNITDTKIIPLFNKTFNLYSKHLLINLNNFNKSNIQIDLLKPWNENGLKFTQAYFSYSFANIFFSKIIDIVDRNLTLSYLGVICSSNKIVIPDYVIFVQANENTRIILDTEYIFYLMDLNYNVFIDGFENEFELLEYFKTSKYYLQIKFSNNSKFRHNVKRLEPFKNLHDNKLLNFPC